MTRGEQQDFNVGVAMIDVEGFAAAIYLTPEGAARERVCMGAAMALAGVISGAIGRNLAQGVFRAAVLDGLAE